MTPLRSRADALLPTRPALVRSETPCLMTYRYRPNRDPVAGAMQLTSRSPSKEPKRPGMSVDGVTLGNN